MAGYPNPNPWGKKNQAESANIAVSSNPFLGDSDEERDDPEMEVSVFGDNEQIGTPSSREDTPIPTPNQPGINSNSGIREAQRNTQDLDFYRNSLSSNPKDAPIKTAAPKNEPKLYDFKIQSFNAGLMSTRDICHILENELRNLVTTSIGQIERELEEEEERKKSAASTPTNPAKPQGQDKKVLPVVPLATLMKRLPELLYNGLNETTEGSDKTTRTREKFLPAYWNDDKDDGCESTLFEFAEGENNPGCWGVIVGQPFDFCWHPPVDSCRIYITTNMCRIYLFWM